MSLAATPVPDALVPDREVFADGVWWLRFPSDGTFASYKAMPAVVRFGSRYYAKASWNSDNQTVIYKQSRYAEPVSVMAPLKNA